jgi:MFS transporter, UMF1 family
MMPTASKKVINSWAMYDWANSVYNLVITTTFFPIYFLAVSYFVTPDSKKNTIADLKQFVSGYQFSGNDPDTGLARKYFSDNLVQIESKQYDAPVKADIINDLGFETFRTELWKGNNPIGKFISALQERANKLIDNDEHNGQVTLLGTPIKNTALYTYALAFAYAIVVLLLPMLTAIADSRGNKKKFMRFFCYMGALSCMTMYFLNKNTIWVGLTCMIISAIGFYGSQVFYNSYLPDIADEKDRDRISAKGYSMGYIGSVLLQVVGFALVIAFGAKGVLFTFLLVGIWWIGFAQIPLKNLPDNEATGNSSNNAWQEGWQEMRKVWAQVKKDSLLKLFLISFFFYISGVLTVMMVATNFGKDELKLNETTLISVVVVIQLVAILGARLIAGLSAKFGNLKVLIFLVLLWVVCCIFGYFTYTATHFYILASIVGLVMGGIQSLSRSTYAKLMPPTKDTASFFSFYDISEKLAMVFGLFAFGFIDDHTGSMRNAIFSLITFFVIGLILLLMALKLYNKRNKLTVV